MSCVVWREYPVKDWPFLFWHVRSLRYYIYIFFFCGRYVTRASRAKLSASRLLLS